MLYSTEHILKNKLRVEDIRELLVKGRIPGAARINVADTLSRSVPLVHPEYDAEGRLAWELTSPGLKYVMALLEPEQTEREIKTEVGSLETLLNKISDSDVKDYLEEAILCLKVGALRACVVFLWAGAVQTLRYEAISKGSQILNASIIKRDPKSRITVESMDDFAYVKDSKLLEVCCDLGILSSGEKKMLNAALDLRNNCGHPDKYDPGIKRVSAYIEDITGIVFL